MTGKSIEDSLEVLKERVQSASGKIIEYKKKEKEWEDKGNIIQTRLAELIKRVEEFSGGG